MLLTALLSLLLVVVPLGGGAILGSRLRYWSGRHWRGVTVVLACLLATTAAAVALAIRWPVVGLWDAGTEGFLLGLGILGSAHRGLADRRNPLLLAVAAFLSLILLEGLSRVFLPPPPGFPNKNGPHLLLANVLRSDLTHQPWDTLCKELVCSILFGDDYNSLLDLNAAERDIMTPRRFRPNAETQHRVLHLGDSMAFGFGLPRHQTFTAILEHLQPAVEHVNAAIPGTAPDAYLRVMRSWISEHRFDLVVMHIYEGNDLEGLDSHYACCNWQSLLVYNDGTATPRCPQPTQPNLGNAGLTWLRFHNPPPYLVRALVGSSSAAAYLAGLMTLEPFFLVDQPMDSRFEHLELILRAAKAELATRGIEFVVDVIPARTWLETLTTWQHYAPRIVKIAERVGVPVLDASQDYRAAVLEGEQLFFEHPADIHFAASGHELMGKWLHKHLPKPGAGQAGST